MAPAAWLLHLLASAALGPTAPIQVPALAAWPPAALAGLPAPALAALPVPPPPPASGAQVRGAQVTGSQVTGSPRTAQLSGQRLVINGQAQQARWLLVEAGLAGRAELWLPLEVLQEQLGVGSRTATNGSLKLEWFGQELVVPPGGQRSLDDEVAVDVGTLLEVAAVRHRVEAGTLNLDLPPPTLLGVRSSNQAGNRRIVLDMAGPALVRRASEGLWLGLNSSITQRAELLALGLAATSEPGGLRLSSPPGSPPRRVFSLGEPARIVIDLEDSTTPPQAERTPSAGPSDPRLLALLGKSLHWDLQVRQGVRINAVRLDPRHAGLELRPLTRDGGMEGLSSLPQLASREGALVAINGGYFNRVRRLPLGAVKADGRWLSGPILGRGVVAWNPRSLPQFGRLRLDESLRGPSGRSYPLVAVNSGYVQRGLSRYTADWGPRYRALSGDETGLIVRADRVEQQLDSASLESGVALQAGTMLIVARGGVALPWGPGDRLSLSSRPSSELGQAPYVMGGGPLLLQGGQIVLNGQLEGFSSAFLQQGAPRTVIASDDRQLWLITLEGTNDAGPSLGQTAQLLQSMGITEALNLDGGSSTGLVLGGSHQVKGRGVAGAIHNGLGLVPGLETGSADRRLSQRRTSP